MSIEELVDHLQKEYDSNTLDADKAWGKKDDNKCHYYSGRAELIEEILKKMGRGIGV